MKEWDRHNIRMSLVQWEHGSERRAQSKLVQFYKKKKKRIADVYLNTNGFSHQMT